MINTFRTNCRIVPGDLASLASALGHYAADHDGCYPAKFSLLLEPTPAKQPYLYGYAEMPKDPWKRPYIYATSADGRSFRLICLGSDGAPGGRDDARDDSLDSTGTWR